MTKEELLKQNGAKSCSFLTKWKGYDVYAPEYGYKNDKNGKPPATGYPIFILEKDGKSRWTSIKEAFDFISDTSEKK